MRRPAALALLSVALTAQVQPVLAQSFFERLFGPLQPQYAPEPQQQVRPPQAPQRRPAPQAQPQPRGAAPQAGQGQPQRQPQGQPTEAHIPEPPPAPYEKDLLRLSEIIGALAFLRSLCTTPDATEWTKRMQELLEAEGTTPGRRERLAGAYNKGYRAYSLTYRVCTPSATAATERYFTEGDQLARTLAGRYGG